MSTLTIRLPHDKYQRLKALAKANSISINSMGRRKERPDPVPVFDPVPVLQAMWQRGPQEELTLEIEQDIVEEVRKVRAQARLHEAS